MKELILNCETVAELKALNLDNASKTEKAITEFLISNLDADDEYDLNEVEVAVGCDTDGNFYITSPDYATNCGVASAFDVDKWWDNNWNDTEEPTQWDDIFAEQEREYL